LTDSNDSNEQRAEAAKALRKEVPRSSHGTWEPAPDRPDPVNLITGQDEGRLQELVPIRHSRMLESSFAFFRGASRIMASDLSTTPVTGYDVQLCGDAHLANFGVYGSPERNLVFDLNDFDETLPGPWEWDLKRLAASFVIAARYNDFDAEHARGAARAAVEAYRTTMADFAGMAALDVWYSRLTEAEIEDLQQEEISEKHRKRTQKFAEKARKRDSARELEKIGYQEDGKYRIKSDPPLLVPLRDLPRADDPEGVRLIVSESLVKYQATISDRLKVLLGRYELVDIAVKVVGVGSVGTRCLVALFIGKDAGDPLFLQLKEANASVLEEFLPKSRYALHGERVVQGQRLMQSSSDAFLGWTVEASGHHYYWRQLKDMKGSADTEDFGKKRMANYGRTCGWTLARSHARSGDPVSMAAYMGSSDTFDDAVADFAVAYADQNEADYGAFKEATDAGEISVESGDDD
jgi:uncharacterized protein (DUF2252 family)